MAQFLFVVEIPATKAMASTNGMPYEWTKFANDASAILKPAKACTRLQQNAWLLPAENAWPLLKGLSSTAEKHSLAYSVCLISGDVVQLTK